MTTHLDTSPTVFSLPTLRSGDVERATTTRVTARPAGRVGAFFGVLIGNIVLWGTMFAVIGLTLAAQLGVVGVIAAALLR